MQRMTEAEARRRPVREGVPPGEAHVAFAETEVVIHGVLPGPVVVTG